MLKKDRLGRASDLMHKVGSSPLCIGEVGLCARQAQVWSGWAGAGGLAAGGVEQVPFSGDGRGGSVHCLYAVCDRKCPRLEALLLKALH